MTQAAQRETLYCSCHGSLTMAKRQGEKIVVLIRKHGIQHTLVIDLTEYLLTQHQVCDIPLRQLNKDA